MSKLPNAPLLEVIFEIKWDITNKRDIVDFQYLHGDLYANIKDKFGYRENLIPPEIPYEVIKGMPAYRFRRVKNGYPLVQVGLGLLTYNIIDKLYYWENFKEDIDRVSKVFFNVYPKAKDLKLTPSITYIDFFNVDFDRQNPVDFINNKLHLNIQQSFINKETAGLKEINFLFNYQIKENVLSLNLKNGMIKENIPGLVLQTKFIGGKKIYPLGDLSLWLDEAHRMCSDIFKKITKKEFYSTFKQ